MLRILVPALLGAPLLADAADRITIGIRLAAPPSTPPALIKALIRETERHWDFPAVVLHWHTTPGSCKGEDQRLVAVRLTGSCTLRRSGDGPPGRPLGVTHVTDHKVLPFVDVDCSSVAASLARWASPSNVFLNTDRYARALAAVLTHEMVHALTASLTHGSSGIMQPRLSPEDLIEPDLTLAPKTVEELEEALGVPLTETRHQ